MYYQHCAYICPQCHAIVHSPLKECLFSAHTPKTRKLTCPSCGRKGFCVEIYREK